MSVLNCSFFKCPSYVNQYFCFTLFKIGNLYRPPFPMIVSKPMVPRDVYAFMRREHFYICGVAVGKANLCHLVNTIFLKNISMLTFCLIAIFPRIHGTKRLFLTTILNVHCSISVNFSMFYLFFLQFIFLTFSKALARRRDLSSSEHIESKNRI